MGVGVEIGVDIVDVEANVCTRVSFGEPSWLKSEQAASSGTSAMARIAITRDGHSSPFLGYQQIFLGSCLGPRFSSSAWLSLRCSYCWKATLQGLRLFT